MARRILRFWVLQSLIILNTFRWVVLAVLAGVVAGVPTGIFLLLLDGGITAIRQWHLFFLMAPVGLFLSSWLVGRFAPQASGHGTEKVIEALHQRSGEMDLKVIPVKLVATLITLILGGSAGKEGPSAQIGAGAAYGVARLLRLNKLDRQRFVLCGISAGFAGVFGTPIAGAIFATEVLFIGRFSYNRLLPSLIAAYTAQIVTTAMGVGHLSYSIAVLPASHVWMLAQMVFFGMALGHLAILLVWALHRVEHLFARVPVWLPLKGLLGGGILILVVLVTGTTNYLGVGTRIVDAALDGQPFRIIAPFFKIFTTAVTLGSGGSGGVLGPIFFIGATAGNVWAQVFDLSVGMFSAIGMVAFLAAATNTPIAAMVMAMELFGVTTGSYAAVACTVAYLVVGHVSVYPSQVIHNKKPFFLDLDFHQVQQEFNSQGIRALFRALFTGFRGGADEPFTLSGRTVLEEQNGDPGCEDFSGECADGYEDDQLSDEGNQRD